MEKYCIFCGQALEQGVCVNAECPTNERNARQKSQSSSFKKPISLLERRRQMYEIEEPAPSEVSPPVPNPEKTPDQTERGKAQETGETENGISRLFFFIYDYYREPGKVVAAAARKRDVGIATVLLLTSIMLSTLGTLLFGYVHLEDFFAPWILCGILTPILAYGVSLLYGRLFVFFNSEAGERRTKQEKEKLPFRELFPTVAVSSMFPNLLLLLSCILSPMDKSFGLFQFFALLITVSWVVSLIFSLFTVYGGKFSLGCLLFTVGFVFVALLTMRTLWVWYITGEFGFSLYIPLSIFFS